VIADRSQLEAALTNLATNARDAMPGGGKLMIETGTRYLDADYAATTHDVVPGDYALIEVTDTGTGMTPDVIHHIFEPFYTTKERDKGTGLGLSMVFGFLKQSGGHVTVYSEIGVGTTFRLYLPCVSGTPEKRETPSRARPSDAAGEVVLVVEDNAPLRRVAVKQLRELGYAVQEVKNGAEAVNVLTREHIDVLFTDIVMPGGMDGFELARSARKNWPGLKILLTSGYPATKLKEDLALVNFPLLSKPYGKAALARAIREILDTPGESSPVGGA
jgi:CheY-like chemotaxis protein